MLSSLRSHEEGEENPNHRRHHQYQMSPTPPPQGGSTGLFLSSTTHAHQLLIRCAELIHRSDFPAARRAAQILNSASSPHGDSTDRLIYQFTRSISLRLDRLEHIPASSGDNIAGDDHAIHSSYLSLNQITPFIRFAHLTANQAILEAVDGRRSIHILDFDTSDGVQWPPFLQALAERSPSDPPSVRITGTGTDLSLLRRTGDRLQLFANSLGLRFHFQPLLPAATTASFHLQPGETLAVNCVLFLHKLLKDGEDGYMDLRAFLAAVKAMNPVVVAVAEREASHNSPVFLHRFTHALDYYTAVFESLEATVPPKSRERLAVEQVWLGREIADVVAGEGEGRRERHERFDLWEGMMRAAGFLSIPLSPFAVSQAKLLLRLHYPSEGYQLRMVGNSFFLGWQNKPLFSISSWH